MCNLAAIEKFREELNDYLNHTSTTVYLDPAFQPNLVVAYGAHHQHPVGTVPQWYKKAYEAWVPYYGDEAPEGSENMYESDGFWFENE